MKRLTSGDIATAHVHWVRISIQIDGRTPISISFGFASYDFTNDKWSTFSKNNKWYENMGYALGAMANLSDVVSLFRGCGQNINVNSASTKGDEDWWGHSSITEDNGNSLVSVGPGDHRVGKTNSLISSIKNASQRANIKWESYYQKSGTWSIKMNNISIDAINRYAQRIKRWGLLGNSCVGHTTKALWMAGVPTLYLFHPHMLNVQLLIRQLGIYSSPYLYQIQ